MSKRSPSAHFHSASAGKKYTAAYQKQFAPKSKPKRPRHLLSGNCWEAAYSCDRCGADNYCDVCHAHDSPRGECKGCGPCPACQPPAPDKREPPPTVMLAVYWTPSRGPDCYVRFGQVMADTGFDAQPTDEEMQRVMYAAKMEWGRCLRRRKK